MASRVRLLGSGRGSKNDPNDALSTAMAALRHRDLRPVAREDHSQVLALLAAGSRTCPRCAPRRSAGCTPNWPR
jgi:hypothetical protein